MLFLAAAIGLDQGRLQGEGVGAANGSVLRAQFMYGRNGRRARKRGRNVRTRGDGMCRRTRN